MGDEAEERKERKGVKRSKEREDETRVGQHILPIARTLSRDVSRRCVYPHTSLQARPSVTGVYPHINTPL